MEALNVQNNTPEGAVLSRNTQTSSANFTAVDNKHEFALSRTLNKHLTTSQHVQVNRLETVKKDIEKAIENNDHSNVKQLAKICVDANQAQNQNQKSKLATALNDKGVKTVDQNEMIAILNNMNDDDKKEITTAICEDLAEFADKKNVQWCRISQGNALSNLAKSKFTKANTFGGYRYDPNLGKPDGMIGKMFGGSAITVDPSGNSAHIKGSYPGSLTPNKAFAKDVMKSMVAAGMVGDNVTITLETKSAKKAQAQIKALVAEAQQRGIPLESIRVAAPKANMPAMTLKDIATKSLDPKSQPGEKFTILGMQVGGQNLNKKWGEKVKKAEESGLNEGLKTAAYSVGSAYLDNEQKDEIHDQIIEDKNITEESGEKFNRKLTAGKFEQALQTSDYNQMPDSTKRAMAESLKSNKSVKKMHQAGIMAINNEIKDSLSKKDGNKDDNKLKELITQQRKLAGEHEPQAITDTQLQAFKIKAQKIQSHENPNFHKVFATVNSDQKAEQVINKQKVGNTSNKTMKSIENESEKNRSRTKSQVELKTLKEQADTAKKGTQRRLENIQNNRTPETGNAMNDSNRVTPRPSGT